MSRAARRRCTSTTGGAAIAIDDGVDDELIDAIDARTDVRIVVHGPGDRRLVISHSLAASKDAEVGIAYVRALLPTFAELADRGVLMIAFAGLGPRELNAIADGRAQLDQELQAGDDEGTRRTRAMLRAAQWSSGDRTTRWNPRARREPRVAAEPAYDHSRYAAHQLLDAPRIP